MEQIIEQGQHFMIDETLLGRIVEVADISQNDVVLEIGSGEGALTKHLLGKGKKLICVEKDSRFSSPAPEVEFHNENVLDILNSLTFDVVVANIPYHISEPLLIQLLLKQAKKMTLVVGETFAKKLLDQTILGTIVREQYDIHVILTIQPSSFSPPPKTLSSLITLERTEQQEFLSMFYNYQSSKVKNYVLKLTEDKFTKKEMKHKLSKSKIHFLEKKLYELSTEEFLELYSFLRKTF